MLQGFESIVEWLLISHFASSARNLIQPVCSSDMLLHEEAIEIGFQSSVMYLVIEDCVAHV